MTQVKYFYLNTHTNNNLNLPIELFIKMINYLDTNNYLNISLVNHNFKKMRLERLYYQKRIITNYASKDDFTSNWYLNYIKTENFKDYLNDIYLSIFLDNLDTPKKTITSSIIMIKKKFNYMDIRNILCHNDFNLINNLDNYREVKIHSMYRIDLFSYFKLRKYHKNILALIY
jgi:hypothetical protein